MAKTNRAIAWKGQSQINGAPISLTVTGMDGSSNNPKTGPMAQTWILASGVNPMQAKQTGKDTAICGDCPLKAVCYVQVKNAPLAVFRKNRKERNEVSPLTAIQTALTGKALRLGAYGDPVAVPFRVWQSLLETVRTWTGYTHQWATCDPQWATKVMASVETRELRNQAQAKGYRTFRVMQAGDTVDAGEVLCPASKEAGFRTTCDKCGLCRGTSNPAKSVAIYEH